MKLSHVVAGALALSIASTVSYAGEASSPVFGKAKAKVMRKAEASKVVGKGGVSDYYGYYGNVYNSYAGTYGRIGQYYNDRNTESYYYYYAYYYAQAAANNYYVAHYYAGH